MSVTSLGLSGSEPSAQAPPPLVSCPPPTVYQNFERRRVFPSRTSSRANHVKFLRARAKHRDERDGHRRARRPGKSSCRRRPASAGWWGGDWAHARTTKFWAFRPFRNRILCAFRALQPLFLVKWLVCNCISSGPDAVAEGLRQIHRAGSKGHGPTPSVSSPCWCAVEPSRARASRNPTLL